MRRLQQAWTAPLVALVATLALATLGGCAGMDLEEQYPRKEGGRPIPSPEGKRETVFGRGGINFFGDEGESEIGKGGGVGIGVNSFLWRASLDTVSFMPLRSADPFGGVIITDWYAPPEAPDSRFQMTVYILDRRLRADGLKVAVFRQSRSGPNWVDAAISSNTRTDLENAILTRARQLRMAAIPQ
ncbi:MAG: DUF3576 domain-containing protein [Alphaproteobacteria bacterium]|nr:DUF3576 domain-containing protein [Alphaproteobacteria bacterium]|tara:strand:- start:774 stop:1331 length:558 start_codon:yes stop_codon:yes gene_type:complete